MKNTLFRCTLTLRLFCFFILGLSSQSHAQVQPALADSFYNFINANRTRASVYINRNDTAIARLNENLLMPLAGTVKLLIAIEFAQQSTHEMINENSYAKLEEVEKYHMPLIDSAAYASWLAYLKTHNEIKNGSVKLVDIARGMMMFDCNANADYLMDILGFDNVKDNIALFKLKQHTAIYLFGGSMFIYQLPKKTSEDKLIKALSKYSDKKYSMEAYYFHTDLKEDSSFKATFEPEQFTEKMQKMWSDNLPASTTKEYVSVLQALNNREVIDEDAFFPIGEVVEYPMENKEYQKKFKYFGIAGGSSAYVLTHAAYFTMKDGNRMEWAVFLNNLNIAEKKKMEEWLVHFKEQFINDPFFRSKIRF